MRAFAIYTAMLMGIAIAPMWVALRAHPVRADAPALVVSPPWVAADRLVSDSGGLVLPTHAGWMATAAVLDTKALDKLRQTPGIWLILDADGSDFICGDVT